MEKSPYQDELAKKSGIVVPRAPSPDGQLRMEHLGSQCCRWALEDNDLKVSENTPGGYSHVEGSPALEVASSC